MHDDQTSIVSDDPLSKKGLTTAIPAFAIIWKLCVYSCMRYHNCLKHGDNIPRPSRPAQKHKSSPSQQHHFLTIHHPVSVWPFPPSCLRFPGRVPQECPSSRRDHWQPHRSRPSPALKQSPSRFLAQPLSQAQLSRGWLTTKSWWKFLKPSGGK